MRRQAQWLSAENVVVLHVRRIPLVFPRSAFRLPRRKVPESASLDAPASVAADRQYKKAVPGCSEHDFAKASSAVLTPMVAAKKSSAPLTAQRFPAFRSCPKHDRGRAAPAPNNAASGTPGAFPHAGTPRMFSAEQDKRRFRRNRRALGFSDLPASVPA